MSTVRWNEKLKILQTELNLSTEQLAETLGMTPRTLYDFMKSEGARPPTDPVKRLIEYLLGERTSPGLREKPQLNLVIIHGDFRIPNGPDGKSRNSVNTVIDMYASGGAYRDNEFHLVTDEPDEELKGYVLDGLTKSRVLPHFFVSDAGLNSQGAKDCYFTATTVWLATQAMSRDLKHITLAADPEKFWPLGRELKDLAGVDVTFIRTASSESDLKIDALLKKITINTAHPHPFRRWGHIHRLVSDGERINYGYIALDEPNEQEDPTIFFSWGHMHKGEDGEFEKKIEDLVLGDQVSFIVGMNNRGRCATDVALRTIEEKPAQGTQPIVLSKPKDKKLEEIEMLDIAKKAVTMSVNKDGWALSSEFGNRIAQFNSNFKTRLNAISPGMKISKFCSDYPDIFEFKPHGTDPFGLIRLKMPI